MTTLSSRISRLANGTLRVRGFEGRTYTHLCGAMAAARYADARDNAAELARLASRDLAAGECVDAARHLRALVALRPTAEIVRALAIAESTPDGRDRHARAVAGRLVASALPVADEDAAFAA